MQDWNASTESHKSDIVAPLIVLSSGISLRESFLRVQWASSRIGGNRVDWMVGPQSTIQRPWRYGVGSFETSTIDRLSLDHTDMQCSHLAIFAHYQKLTALPWFLRNRKHKKVANIVAPMIKSRGNPRAYFVEQLLQWRYAQSFAHIIAFLISGPTCLRLIPVSFCSHILLQMPCDGSVCCIS